MISTVLREGDPHSSFLIHRYCDNYQDGLPAGGSGRHLFRVRGMGEEKKFVPGSECALWTESITIDKIYPRIKNRLEAHAEKCWTPKEMKSYPDFINRLNVLREYFRFQYSGASEIR